MKTNLFKILTCVAMLLSVSIANAQPDGHRHPMGGERSHGRHGGPHGRPAGVMMPPSANPKTMGRDTAYVSTIMARAEKNISALNLTGAKHDAVRDIVVNRYFELNDIYTERDRIITFAKDSLEGKAKQWAIENARAVADSKCYRTHFAMPAQLSLYLDDKQIEMVKDGITFNKVKVTYEAYLDEIPSLKDEEKAQIYAWMIEARELALDAESSKMKHEVFNKYKGRVNNYLSKRGYDLNKEREAWFKRLEERKNKQQKTNDK